MPSYSKADQLHNKRIKLTQKQMGDISAEVDKQLKERSHGICELCERRNAVQRAHLTGRKQLDHKTKVTDLLHVCIPCHDWLDKTTEGLQARRFIARAINCVLADFDILPGNSGKFTETKGSVRDG